MTTKRYLFTVEITALENAKPKLLANSLKSLIPGGFEPKVTPLEEGTEITHPKEAAERDAYFEEVWERLR